ncbi:MAG: hypothetical protein KGI38_10575 [Thaumarchaeota archaeon]|nr:hypothetical protein [Nitrososphaerota archaeon]
MRSFVSKRKEAQHYSIEEKGGCIVVHTPDPLVRSRGGGTRVSCSLTTS